MNSFIAAYNRAPSQKVCDVYKKPSEAKKIAERMILREMVDCRGWGYKVINHTCQHFTAGYLYANKHTGEIVLSVHTPNFTADVEWCHTNARVV